MEATNKKLVWTKSAIRSDIMYIRSLLREAEIAMNDNDWVEAEAAFQEIAACGATNADWCVDNNESTATSYSGEVMEVK
tara:strand:- start:258 stop:494 length:237 start_codon:yes stop_codon:yes gene_type:complete